jgi:hypothetical protein
MRVTLDIPDTIFERLKQASTPSGRSVDHTLTLAAIAWLADEAGWGAALDACEGLPEANRFESMRSSLELRRLQKEKTSEALRALENEVRRDDPNWVPF